MKNFRRIMAVCLVLILAVGAFTGCRKKKADGNAVPAAAETALPIADGKEPAGNEDPVDTGTDKPEPAAQETGKYEVLVKDEEGNPVPGVMIQFCSDTECVLGQTGEDGIAAFEKEAGEYSVHVLKAPEGYDADDTEYSAPSEPGILTIELRAQAQDEAADDAYVQESEALGVRYVVPEKYRNLKGSLTFDGGFSDSGILELDLTYYAVSPERMDEYWEFCKAYLRALIENRELPEAPDPSWMTLREAANVFTVFGISEGGEAGLQDFLQKNGLADIFAWLEEVWTDGSSTFFIGQRQHTADHMDEYRDIMGDFFPEFEEIFRDKDTFLSAVTFKAPVWPTEIKVGEVIHFETTDLDGNPVSSETLFARNKVTMINLWGTWCGPCKRELPELARMAKEFEQQGCMLVGICNDAYQEGIIEVAKGLLQDAGAEYLNLVGSPALDTMLHAQGFPSTYFVDREGRLLLPPIVGAYVDKYPEAVAEALSLAG